MHYSWGRSDRRPVKDIYFHPKFSASQEGVENNIALVRLEKMFLDNLHVSVVTLAGRNSSLCKKGVTVGVGKTEQGFEPHAKNILYNSNITPRLRLPAVVETRQRKNIVFYSYVIRGGNNRNNQSGTISVRCLFIINIQCSAPC